MSRHLSGSSGSSHSFGGSFSGGSRSFGGSSFNGTRKVSSSSSSRSSSNNDFDFRGENGAIIIELIIRLLIVIYDIFGILGVLIAIITIACICLFIVAPIIAIILLVCSIVGFILYFTLRKKKEVKESIVDLIDHGQKYDPEITHSEDFNRFMLDQLRSKNLLNDRGELLYNKIDQFHYEFDDIYNNYMYHK